MRIGPLRLTQAGLVTPRAMITAMVIVFSLAVVVCIRLISAGAGR